MKHKNGTNILNTGKEVVDVGPIQVEKDVLEVFQRLYDYDPNLEILYLDPERAEFMDAPYMIAERCSDGQLRKVFEVWELNETVIERVYKADTRRNDVLAALDKHNNQVRRDIQRRYEEEREEMKDIFSHLLKSPQGKYSFPNKQGQIVTVDDHLGIIKKEGGES